MIHQVFLNAINHNFFDLGDVNLLIVDECHHAVGNSAYVQIFQKYKEFKVNTGGSTQSADQHKRVFMACLVETYEF
jgi:ERCC4-related helicase